MAGANAWNDPKHGAVIEKAGELLSVGATVCAICGATAALAGVGLFDKRPHTSNGAGAAEQRGTRCAVLQAIRKFGFQKDSVEVLTPILHDPPSIIPFAVVLTALLVNPRNAGKIAASAVRSYSVLPETIQRIHHNG